jgi:2-polyprenyl-3-methyl-5-hydroxy-6-metoxy-1,4-benzoquinol methylase
MVFLMSTLSEHDIRPEHLMSKQRIFALTDVGRMLSRYGEFVEVDCPACGGGEHKPKYEKNGLSYVECSECRTFYISPRPTPDVLEWFYRGSPNYAYWNDVIFPASETKRREEIFVPRVDRLLDLCQKYKVSTNSMLEIGAGFGTFCGEVKKRNVFKRVVAVEPTPDLAKTCKERGLEVMELPVEQIKLDKEELFDVVASFEVIEHLFAPVDFVGHMTRLLKPGGIMMLTCPNGQGFDIEVLGTASNTVDHEHLNYFNPESLSRLITNCGLEILESFTPGKLDADLVRNKIISGDVDLANQPFLKSILIEKWDLLGVAFQDFLIKQGLSSNMWVVARKPHD